MKTLIQIPVLFLIFFCISFKISATSTPAFSGENVEVWVYHACEEASLSGKIDLRIFSDNGPFQIVYTDESLNEVKNVLVTEGNTGEEDLENVPSGYYSIKIISAQCSLVELQVYIEVMPQPEITAELQPFCQAGTGKIIPQISGGQEPFSYLWSNEETSKNIFQLDAGNYTLTLTYGNGCTSEKSFEVEYTQNPIEITQNIIYPCDGGRGEIDLNITGGVGPFTIQWYKKIGNFFRFPYFLISEKKNVLPGSDEEKIRELLEGDYFVVITDSEGCIAYKNYKLENNVFDVEVELDYDCVKQLIYKITAIPRGGVENYKYAWTWFDIPDIINYNTTTGVLQREHYQIGKYSLTVEDGRGCKVDKEFYYGPLKIDGYSPHYLCPNAETVLSPIISGGNPPYSFLWSNGITYQSLNGIQPNTFYSITVSDRLGCTASKQFEVKEWEDDLLYFRQFSGIDPSAQFCSVYPQDCACDGRLELTGEFLNDKWANSNWPPIKIQTYYQNIFNWEKLDESNFKVNIGENFSQLNIAGGARPSVFNICSGRYKVTPKGGCPIEIELTPRPCDSRIVLDKITHACECVEGDCLGSLSIKIISEKISDNIIWYKNNVYFSDKKNISNLCPGIYKVEYYFSQNEPPLTAEYEILNDCTQNFISLLEISEKQNATDCTSNDGFIKLNLKSGNEATFSWSNGTTGPMIENLAQGDYTVTVTSSCFEIIKSFTICSCNDCIFTTGIKQVIVPSNCNTYQNIKEIVQNLKLQINQITGPEENDGSIISNNFENPISELEFHWSGPNNFYSNSINIYNLTVGKYTLNIKDGCGKIFEFPYYIISEEQCETLALSLSTENCGFHHYILQNPGPGIVQLILNVENGSNNYTYTIKNNTTSTIKEHSFNSNTQTVDIYETGQHIVSIFDNLTGCLVSESINIFEESKKALRVEEFSEYTWRDCKTQDTHTSAYVRLLIEGGTEPYYIKWQDGETNVEYKNLFNKSFDCYTNQKKFTVDKNVSFNWSVTVTDACGIEKVISGKMACNGGLDENGKPIPCEMEGFSIDKNKVWASNGDPEGCFDRCGDFLEFYCSQIEAKLTDKSKSYTIFWPNGSGASILNENHPDREYNVPNLGIYTVTVRNNIGCEEYYEFIYNVDCDIKTWTDFLSDENENEDGCPKIKFNKQDVSFVGENYSIEIDLQNTNLDENKTNIKLLTFDGELIFESDLNLTKGKNKILIPVNVINSSESKDFIARLNFANLPDCPGKIEFNFNIDKVDNCPTMIVNFNDGNGQVEIFSPKNIPGCTLKITGLYTQVINLLKDESYIYDFNLSNSGDYKFELILPSSANCYVNPQTFTKSNDCNNCSFNASLPDKSRELQIQCSTSAEMKVKFNVYNSNNSKIEVTGLTNIEFLINGSFNLIVSVGHLTLGNYKITMSFINPKCSELESSFIVTPACEYYYDRGDYDSASKKAFVFYRTYDKEIRGKYYIYPESNPNNILIQENFKLNAGIFNGIFSIDLKDLLPGRYTISWSPYVNHNCGQSKTFPAIISGFNDDDPPTEFKSCNDDIFDLVFDSIENKYITYWSSPENDSILVGYSFGEDVTNMDFYSILDKPLGHLNAVRNDSIKNHYFTIVSDTSSSFIISKVGILNNQIWDTTFTAKRFISQSKHQGAIQKIIVEDESTQQLQVLIIDSDGQVTYDSISIPQIPYFMIKHLKEGIVTARYTNDNLSIMYHRFDGVRKEVLLDKKIQPVDIQSINDNEITLGAEFRGDIQIDTMNYSSGITKNMLFIKFNNDLEFVKVIHEFSQKDQNITAFANDGSNTLAVAGINSLESNSYYNDSCIFIKVLYWENPVTCSASFEILENPCHIDSVFSIKVYSPFPQNSAISVSDTSQVLYNQTWNLQKGVNNLTITSPIQFTSHAGKYKVQIEFENCPTLTDTLEVFKGFQFDCSNEIIDLNYDSLENQFTYFSGVDLVDTIHGYWYSFDTLSGFFNEFTRHEIQWDWIKHVRYDSTKTVYYFGTDSIIRSFVTSIDTNGVSNTTWFYDVIFMSCGPLNQQGVWTLIGYKISEQKYYMYWYDKVNLTPLPLDIPYEYRGQTYTKVWNFGPEEYATKIISGQYEIVKFSSLAYPPFEVSLTRPFKVKTVNKWDSNQWLVSGDLEGTMVIAGDTIVSEEWTKSVFIWYDWQGTVVKYKVIESEEDRIITHVATDGYQHIFFAGMEIDTVFHENPDSITIESCIFGDTLTINDFLPSLKQNYNQNTSIASMDKTDGKLRFYPNPFNQGINVQYDSNTEEAVSLTCVGMLGNVLFEKQWRVTPGLNDMYLKDFEALPGGMYSVIVKTFRGDKIHRVIKIE